jgi:hypothetical protein
MIKIEEIKKERREKMKNIKDYFDENDSKEERNRIAYEIGYKYGQGEKEKIMEKHEIIKHFQELTGSKAQTVRGLHRALIAYLSAHHEESIHMRGYEVSQWRNTMKSHLNTVISARADRAAKRFGVWARHDAEELADTISLKSVFLDGNNWPLARSRSSWAGGEHSTIIKIGHTPSCEGWSKRVWSSNGKWSGNDSYVSLTVTIRALQYFPTLRTPDGSVVLDAEEIEPRVFRLVWVEQARGFDIKPREGWLIRGYHSTKKSLKAAKKEAHEARQKSVSALLAKRQYTKNIKHVWVSIEDSLAAGNCKSQTDAFASRVYSEIGHVGGLRADVLIAMRDDIYTRRAVGQAIKRYSA